MNDILDDLKELDELRERNARLVAALEATIPIVQSDAMQNFHSATVLEQINEALAK